MKGNPTASPQGKPKYPPEPGHVCAVHCLYAECPLACSERHEPCSSAAKHHLSTGQDVLTLGKSYYSRQGRLLASFGIPECPSGIMVQSRRSTSTSDIHTPSIAAGDLASGI
jgi:hypothetical protein